MQIGDSLIPMFIESKTLEGLRLLMIKTNKFYTKNFKYDWNFANKKYVALYYLDLKDLERFTDKELNKKDK